MNWTMIGIAATLFLAGCDEDEKTPPPVAGGHVQCAGTDKVRIGMTRDELIQNCGQPVEINTDETKSYKTEQFVYVLALKGTDNVYVVNGVVNSVQY